MKKFLITLVCVLLTTVSANAMAKDDIDQPTALFTTTTTDPPSALSKLEKLAKDVKKKTHKNTSDDDEEETTTEETTVSDNETDNSSSKKKNVLGNILGGVGSAATSTSTITNVLGDVTGLNKLKEKKLHGTWKYSEPGVAFTSESLLAEAGGEVAATACREKLQEAYESIGITPDNTSFTFKEDGSFEADVAGHSVKGKYTFDEDEQTISLKVLIVSLTGHTKINLTGGISLMFESQKILSLLEAICKVTGSNVLKAVGDLSSQYDGVRVGFELSK